VSAWRDTAAIIRDFPVVGTGFGGYGTAMLVYQTSGRQSIYVQAHNEYLQVLAEGGALVAVPAGIVLALVLASVRHRLRGRDDLATYWLRAGAIAGLAGIAAQSLMEFSLQMPGNTLMFAFLLAVALHRPASHSHANRV
jgi:O-antigen ligase